MSKKRIIIIDGYNAMHRIPLWKRSMDRSLEEGRAVLLRYCGRWIMTRGDVWVFYVVFDGESGVGCSRSQAGQGVRVVFTRTREDADDRILDIIKEYAERFNCAVVSDDNYVRSGARRLGAGVMPVTEFAGVLSTSEVKRESPPPPATKPKRGGKQRRPPDNHDGSNLHPSAARAITEDLKKAWLT